MSTESFYRRQRELVRNLFRFLNQAHANGELFDRVTAFGGEGTTSDGAMLRWTSGIFRRLKEEGAIEMVGTKFRPKYKALANWGEVTEDLVSDYATTTGDGEAAYTRRVPQMPQTPAVRYGKVVGAEGQDNNGETAEEDEMHQEAQPQANDTEGPKPTMEQMLEGFFQLLPHLIPAIHRIEKRQIEMDRKLTKIYEDLIGPSKSAEAVNGK